MRTKVIYKFITRHAWSELIKKEQKIVDNLNKRIECSNCTKSIKIRISVLNSSW